MLRGYFKNATNQVEYLKSFTLHDCNDVARIIHEGNQQLLLMNKCSTTLTPNSFEHDILGELHKGCNDGVCKIPDKASLPKKIDSNLTHSSSLNAMTCRGEQKRGESSYVAPLKKIKKYDATSTDDNEGRETVNLEISDESDFQEEEEILDTETEVVGESMPESTPEKRTNDIPKMSVAQRTILKGKKTCRR
ncbi:hypothetical protein ACFE04_021751 [Oxalis oulophora]